MRAHSKNTHGPKLLSFGKEAFLSHPSLKKHPGDNVAMQPAPSQDLVPGAGPHVIAFNSDGVSVKMCKTTTSITSMQGAALANAVRFGCYFDLVESHGADF